MEILSDFPEGLDYLIAGVGTGGHITGCAEVLKPEFPNLKVLAVEPETSAVLSGEAPGSHPLQGLGAGFIPSVLNTSVLDGIIKVGRDESFEFTRRAAREDSSGFTRRSPKRCAIPNIHTSRPIATNA